MLSYSFSPLMYADFFKWELLVSEKGYGTESLNFPIVAEGKIDFLDETFMCSMRNFWTKLNQNCCLKEKHLNAYMTTKRELSV